MSVLKAVADASAEKDSRIEILQALVETLNSGLVIMTQHFINGAPEPQPGAVQAVARASLMATRIAREAGIMPPDKERQP